MTTTKYVIMGLEPWRDRKYRRYAVFTESEDVAKLYVKGYLVDRDIGVRYCLVKDRVKHEEELDLIELLLK